MQRSSACLRSAAARRGDRAEAERSEAEKNDELRRFRKEAGTRGKGDIGTVNAEQCEVRSALFVRKSGKTNKYSSWRKIKEKTRVSLFADLDSSIDSFMGLREN